MNRLRESKPYKRRMTYRRIGRLRVSPKGTHWQLLKDVRGREKENENMINHMIKFMIIVKENTIVMWL